MYAGASGASHNVNKNSPGNGNGKWQGLPGLTNVRSALVYPIRTRANGDGLEKVFCINQLSGVGRISTMFASTADGVKEPCHGSSTGKSGGVLLLAQPAPRLQLTPYWTIAINSSVLYDYKVSTQDHNNGKIYSTPQDPFNPSLTFTSATEEGDMSSTNTLSGRLYEDSIPPNLVLFKSDNSQEPTPQWQANVPIYIVGASGGPLKTAGHFLFSPQPIVQGLYAVQVPYMSS